MPVRPHQTSCLLGVFPIPTFESLALAQRTRSTATPMRVEVARVEVGRVVAGGGLAQGIEHVMSELNRRLIHFKLETVRPDMTWGAGIHSYGAYAITGTPPWSDAGKPASVAKVFLDAGAALGTTVAQRLGSR